MSKEVLFLCQHGGAKSVVAAAYFNAAGLPLRAVAAAAEDPYDAVPVPVVEFLAAEGFDVSAFKPRAADTAETQNTRVIAIGCDVPNAERWDDVPQMSDDLHGSVAAIRRHVDALIAELRRG